LQNAKIHHTPPLIEQAIHIPACTTLLSEFTFLPRTTLNQLTHPAPLAMAPKAAASGKQPAKRSAIADVVAREYTIHLHKRVR
jgi:hypothetical protein